MFNIDNVSAETEDIAYIQHVNKIYNEPIFQSRFNSFTYFFNDKGSAVIGKCHTDSIGVVGSCSSNIGISQRVNGSNTSPYSGNDWGCMKAISHKLFPPATQSPYSYSLTLSCDYVCDYWVTQDATFPSMICRSYYEIIGYNSNDNIVSRSSKKYIAHYDTFEEIFISPNNNGKVHSAGSTTYTIDNNNIAYLKVQYVTEGSWLHRYQGISITYTNIQLKYNLFSGTEYSRGDSFVTIGKSYPSDGLVSLKLRDGQPNGNDYGTIKARTTFLYLNNNHASTKNYVGDFKIDYQRIYWDCSGSFVYQGYFKIHYYDKQLIYLGTDTNQFIDYNSVTSPYKYLAPSSSGTLSISNPSEYDAKYIQVELILTGSWLHSLNGAEIKFSNLRIAGGGGYNIEVMYYYQSDYLLSQDLTSVEYFLLNQHLLEKYNGGRLFKIAYKVDDQVTTSDFYQSSSDDVRGNDFFIFSGHGGRGLDDTYLCLTDCSNVDDDDIGNWGPETEIVFLYACHILGNNLLGYQQRGEWAVHGLYYNHGILGFYDEVDVSYNCFNLFLNKLRDGWSLANAFEYAFDSQPWVSIWDESWQANSDYLWDIDPYSYGWSSDETSNDSTYYVRMKDTS